MVYGYLQSAGVGWYHKSAIRYVDYTIGLQQLRLNKTKAYQPGKDHLQFGNGDKHYKGKPGEKVLGLFHNPIKNTNKTYPATVLDNSNSSGIYVTFGIYIKQTPNVEKLGK